MVTWLLILIIAGSSYSGSRMQIVEFNSKATCEAGLAEIVKIQHKVTGVCVLK